MSTSSRAGRALASASTMALAIAATVVAQPAIAQSAPQPQTAPQSAPERPSGLPPAAREAEAAADAAALRTEPASSSDIVVTATRVIRDGYAAPTPVTVLGEDDIALAGQANVFSAALQLPSLAGSNSSRTFGTTQSAGTGGLSSLNLRGLGTNRTLTLLDGQRVVSALDTGVIDAGAFPQALVKRVEVVTGGASASWGSDAVAGVVNYVLDHDFTGIKGNIHGGITTYGDGEEGVFSLTAGTRFADDRAHFVISGEVQRNAGIPRGIGKRDWFDGTRILSRTIPGTPAGQPQNIVAPNVVDIRLAPGGIITSGPLRGIAFGPGGTPYNFRYGDLVVDPRMSGGDQGNEIGNNSNLDAALQRDTLYARLSYDISTAFNVYATYNYGRVRTRANSFKGQYRTALTMQCDNAFLPASVAQACADNGITQFQLGSHIADLPDSFAVNTRTMNRFTAGLNGSFPLFGNDWALGAYYTHGKTFTETRLKNVGLNAPLFAAIDAVKGPNGTIVCRSALARVNGCVPFNIFGTGVVSQAAIDAILGEPFRYTRLKQDAAAVSASGDLFNNWAGPVSLAIGAEYRRESYSQESDPRSVGNGGNPLLSPTGNNWFTGNFQSTPGGGFNVREAFVETVVPLVDNDTLGTAELSLAARATDYSQAGYVTTWKVGGTWDTPIDGLRLRGLQSRDIRAPNLAELFRAPSNLITRVTDLFPPFAGTEFLANAATTSNPNLTPEISRTKQIGVVYQPAWLSGFSASVDYYNISVKDAIGTISMQQTMDLCFQGDPAICDLITRDAAGQITEIRLVPLNLASTKTSGIDLEASFRRPLGDLIPGADGVIMLRGLATHVIKYDTLSGLPNAVVQRIAGQNTGSIARWRVFTTQSYSNERFTFSVTQRYVSPGVINNNWIECTSNCPAPTFANPTVNNNRIAGAFYVDIGGSIKLTNPDQGFKSELYFKIDNLFNIDPPIAPASDFLVRSVNPSLYDLLGRSFRIGAHFSF